MTKKTRICLVFISLLITGCHLGPPYKPPVVPIPDEWKYSKNPEEVEEEDKHVLYQPTYENWWEVFEDLKLNELEQLASQNNKNLQAAFQRIIQARALAGVERADLYPQLNLYPVYRDIGRLNKLYGSPPPNLIRIHEWILRLPITLTYELDLWGKLKGKYESAFFHAQAEEDAFQTALLLLTTDLANSYFNARYLDNEIDLYKTTLETRRKALQINKDRYESHIAFYADVSRAALELHNVEAEYDEILRQRAILENQIAVLIGVSPAEFCLEHLPLTDEPPEIPPGLPAYVISQRPDISQAEREMASKHALIGVAYASYLPDISLTGTIGFFSPQLSEFLKWKSRYWDFGADGSQMLFDGGRVDSKVDYAWARFREASESYQQQVLTAFQEVEDSLSTLEFLLKESDSLTLSVEAAKKTYNISNDRYLNGVDFYLAVVDSERDELNAERTLIRTKGLRFMATVQLIKALGGCW